jgi:hypothetical protein
LYEKRSDFYRFLSWYYLGRRGVWYKLGYDSWEELFPMGVKLRKLLVVLGWALAKTHNIRWRLGLLREVLKRDPQIRRL